MHDLTEILRCALRCMSGGADGRTTLHALGSLESRGSLFAQPQTEVYTGMLVRSPLPAVLTAAHSAAAWCLL